MLVSARVLGWPAVGLMPWTRRRVYILAAGAAWAVVLLWLATYNLEMGPPLFAPLLAGLVGGMGLLASILRREEDPEVPA